MKTGRPLDELMAELERQSNAKRDFVVSRGMLTALPVANTATGKEEPNGNLQLALGDAIPRADLRTNAHRQLGEHLAIPAKFYDRLRHAHPDLAAVTVNTLLREQGTTKRMVRTLDGDVRALLSDSYRPLENFDLAQAVLPVLRQQGVEVRSCQVTERKLFIKAVFPGTKAEIPPPGVTDWQWGKEHHAIDVVEPGIEIGNSEVGCGSLYVKPGVHTVRCSNLAVFQSDVARKTHLGARVSEGEFDVSNRTRRLEDAAVWSKLEDLVKAALMGELFERYVHELRVARGQVVEAKQAPMVFKEITTRMGLNEGERQAALGHFIEGADLTRYGVAAAVTRLAADVESYDRSSELEGVGGQIIELPRNDWQQVLDRAA